MPNRPPAWVDPLMRFGFAARGLVYVIIGALALLASVDGGRTPDSKTALGTLLQMPFGKMSLALIALGLAAYARGASSMRASSKPRFVSCLAACPPDLQTLATRARALLTR